MTPTRPLLETKLHIPRQSRGRVARARLSDRLSQGAQSALTLVSAPAGFGKTTVLTEWLDSLPEDGPSRAWLSLDQRDNDATSFWTYVIAALQTAAGSEFGAASLSLLRSSQAPLDAVVATLLNDIVTLTEDALLVLDDYHVIEELEVHESVALLLDRLPPQFHLLIATRVDPPFPPIAVWEFSLGVWLVVKGFRPSPEGSEAAATTVRDREPDLAPAVA